MASSRQLGCAGKSEEPGQKYSLYRRPLKIQPDAITKRSMSIRPAFICLFIGVAAACGEKPAPPPPAAAAAAADSKPSAITVLDSWTAWVKQDTGPESKVEVIKELPETAPDPKAPAAPPLPDAAQKAGILVLKGGSPFSAVKYTGPETLLNLKGYEIKWDAMRTGGSDFFSALTFPVGDWKTCVSIVNGGWGGTVVGVSNIGFANASENETSRGYTFTNGRWYEFTVQVTPDVIRLLINGVEQFKVTVTGKKLSMHMSEITKCQPLGFSSYSSDGAIRHLRIRALAAGELVPEPEAP